MGIKCSPLMAPTPNTGQQVNGHATSGFELTYTACKEVWLLTGLVLSSSPSHRLHGDWENDSLEKIPPMAPTPNTGQQVNGHATGGFELTCSASSPSHKLYMGLGIQKHCAPH